MTKLPKLGFLYLDHVWRFFTACNFKHWPEPIETVTYHWHNDKERFIQEVLKKKIDVLIGNIPATAYETFREIAIALPHVRFIPSLNSQFANKSKENVTLFCQQHQLPIPQTAIFYDEAQGYEYLRNCTYPKIIKRSYGPSNYGGYFVHKVDNQAEAVALFQKKQYMPMYIQDCIPLTADIRVMLIGHQPVCAFWRVAGKDQWITNTSQGGHMNYSGVPQAALTLAMAASRAAQAEFWACDIAESHGDFYILECATAFAAFPYIRDWIAQYLMWDLCPERFSQPYIPLYHWEALGKVDANVLRQLRHIEFTAELNPSVDGELYFQEGYEQFSMERTTDLSNTPRVPYAQHIRRIGPESCSTTAALAIPAAVETHLKPMTNNLLASEQSAEEGLPLMHHTPLSPTQDYPIPTPALPITMMLPTAITVITSHTKPLPIRSIHETTDTPLPSPSSAVTLAGIDINHATQAELQRVAGMGEKRALAILHHRQQCGDFTHLDDLLKVHGIGKKLLAKLAQSLHVN